MSQAECKLIYGNQIFDTMACAEGNYNEGTCYVSEISLIFYLFYIISCKG